MEVYIPLRRPRSFTDDISRPSIRFSTCDVGFLVWRGLGGFYVLIMLRCILTGSGCFCVLTGPECLHILHGWGISRSSQGQGLSLSSKIWVLYTHRVGRLFILKGSGMSVPSQGWGASLSSHYLFLVNGRKWMLLL